MGFVLALVWVWERWQNECECECEVFTRRVHVFACLKCLTRKGVNCRRILFVCRGLVWTFWWVALQAFRQPTLATRCSPIAESGALHSSSFSSSLAASMLTTESSSRSWLRRRPNRNSMRLKRYSSKGSNHASANKKIRLQFYTFFSHFSYLHTHAHT